MLKLYNLILVNLLLFTSCSVVSFEELIIESNLSKNSLYFNNEFFQIKFSIPINENCIEEIISIKENNSTIKYTIEWNGSTLLLKPISEWKQGAYYSVNINGTAKTKDNKNYELSKNFSFYYGQAEEPFILLNYTTPNSTSKKLVLNFNKAVNIQSFEEKFSLSPFIRTKKNYTNNNKRIEIIPENDWTVNTVFNFSIKELLSETNDILLTSYTNDFLANIDLNAPKLISIKPAIINNIKSNEYTLLENNFNINEKTIENISINNSLSFTFNKEMDLNSFETNFSISPKTPGRFYKDKETIIFIPDDYFQIKNEYTIKIDENLCDKNGLKIFSKLQYTFEVENDFLSIEKININDSSDIQFYNKIENFTNDENIQKINISDLSKTFIQIYFSKPIDKKNPENIEKLISIESFLPKNLSYPKLERISFPAENQIIFEYSNFDSSSTEDYIYKIKINSSKNIINSTSYEYLKEDQCILFIAK